MSGSKVGVELRHDGGWLHLTLNAPKANVLDAQMLAGLSEAIARHAGSPALKAIVFEGAGAHFSFGASVEEHQAEQVAGMLERFHALFGELASHAVPTFAVVRGQCLGGGLELASYCSWIFAHPEAKLGQPEIKLAVFPPLASILLPWRCGGAAAVDLCVSGRSMDAEEARRIGLVHAIDDDPAAACQRFYLETIAPLSASSLRFAERAARHSLQRALRDDLPALERLYVDELMKTPDANVQIAAFLHHKTTRRPQ